MSAAAPGGLELEEVVISHGGQRILGPLSLRIAPGEIVTLMGPSGSGKSSLLNHICGTLPHGLKGEGAVRVDGERLNEMPPERRRIGILFQEDLLFPHLSVGENLAFGLPAGLRGRSARRQRVEAALEEAGLGGFSQRDPATLSGGQRARVALMRTLLSEPRALLLDEPFAKLDVALRERIRRFVFDHARARQRPTLLVTHDPQDAVSAGGRSVELL
ncbi:MAG: ATP-binding cassette domain-containing protein [Rhodovibrionaceae bacterium]